MNCPDCGGDLDNRVNGSSLVVHCTQCAWSVATTNPASMPDMEPLPDPYDERLGRIAHDVVAASSTVLSDELVAHTCIWNRSGYHVDTARAVAFELLSSGTPVDETTVGQIEELLRSEVDDAQQVAEIDQVIHMLRENQPLRGASGLPYQFASNPINGGRVTENLIDRAESDPGVLAVWQASRWPLIRSPWPLPRDVFLVETTPESDPVLLMSALHGVLLVSHVTVPIVELRTTGSMFTDYQQAIVENGRLVWERSSPAPTFEPEIEAENGETIQIDGDPPPTAAATADDETGLTPAQDGASS